MALTADTISRKHRKDLAYLRRRGLLTRVILGVSLALLIFIPALLWWGVDVGPTGSSTARQSLLLSGGQWGRELVLHQREYRDWVSYVAFPNEVRVFDSLSEALFSSAQHIGGEREDLSFFSNTLVSLHFAALRIAFIFIACWKLWLLVIGIAAYQSRHRWKPYQSDDLLGQSGNGRIFYSGVRAALENLDEKGRPSAQVVGLACVPRVSDEHAKASRLVAILESFGARNDTNSALAATILKFPSYPAYIAERSEHAKLEFVFSGASLIQNTEVLLEQMLGLHRRLADAQSAPEPASAASGPVEGLSSEEYTQLLVQAAERVLTSEQRAELAALPPAQVATALLSLEAGKILAYGYEGEKWIRRSNFPQLAARAVVHSIAAFARDYDTESRTLIRGALIYGSRRSVFAPVRLPRDMTARARALRQWAELLLACPHELASVAHEVELLALVTEAHSKWEDKFFRALSEQRAELCQGAYSTLSNLALFPLSGLLKLLRASVDRAMMTRLEGLVQAVSQKQRLDYLALDAQAAEGGGFSRAVREHVVVPLSFQEIKDLSRDHGLSPDEIKDWSTFRVVLQMFGWLARRVGDYTVPPSSLILAVLTPEDRTAECNELGLIARRGVVPLRATRLIDRFGKQWSLKLERVTRARMAVAAEQLEKLMKGAGEDIPQEDMDGGGSSGAPNPPRA